MKIKMLTSMAGADISLVYGETIDLPDATALAWIEAGIAAPLLDPAPVEEAIAPAVPETAITRRRKAK